MVLGPAFWKAEFATNPSVLGRHVRPNGTEFTVIGIAPHTFAGTGIFADPDFYMPLAMAAALPSTIRRISSKTCDDRELSVNARLKPGITLQPAQSELAVLTCTVELFW